MQELLDLRQLLGEKSAVSSDRVATQRNGAGLGNVLVKEGKGLVAGLIERGGRLLDLFEQTRFRVHVADEIIHRLEGLGSLMDDEARSLGNDLEFVVGDQRRYLDNDVPIGIEAGHLQIHPDKHQVTIRQAIQYGCAVLEIPLVRLHSAAALPAYATAGDAGADLVAAVDVALSAGGGRALVPTGAAIAIPEGYAGFVQPRSGLALRHGVTCLNTPGLIDSGYRGELKVLLINTDPTDDFTIQQGDRIAQLVIQAVEHVRFVEVDELPDSERGDGGFGSTGVRPDRDESA